MRIETESHLHGEVIVEHSFPEEHQSLIEVIGSLPIPLRPADDFSSSGRPLKPKRHMRTIGGERRPFLLPVDQAALNGALKSGLRNAAWLTEPVASGNLVGGDTPLGLRGDFVRNKVFVEVEFGNAASMHRDFFKFQIANRAGAGDVAVLVVATQRFGKFFDSGVASYETAVRYLPYLAIGIQMPIWFVGIEPSNFDEIRVRYEEMHSLCLSNGLECHSFDVALGAEVPLEAEAEAEDVDEESAT